MTVPRPAVRRRQRLERAADPSAAGSAKSRSQSTRSTTRLAAERREPLVDLLADGAEFHIGGVAERQHAELDAVEARRGLAHQFVVGAHGARRRLAFAPGRGDDDQPLRRGERGDVEIGHVDERRLKPFLRAALATSPASFSRIAGFGGVEDGQRLGRRGAGAAGCAAVPCTNSTPARKAGEPGALGPALAGPTTRLRSAMSSSAKRRGLRDGGERRDIGRAA